MPIRDVIERHAYFAHGGDPDAAVEAWWETGFEAHEVEEWLSARCFSPDTARDLGDAGLTSEMACMPTRDGAGDYVGTVAFKASDGDLGVDEARGLAGVA